MVREIRSHGIRTAWLSTQLCVRLGLPGQQQADIAGAAAMHDIGKLGLPAELLDKPAALTPQERLQIERHCLIGAGLLALDASSGDAESTTTSIAVVLSHHEWWNGRGYPFGLSGRAIPRAARIVAVADVFDALTSARTYKPAWSRDSALEHIVLGRGVQFDPECVDAFVDVVGALSPDWAEVSEDSTAFASSWPTFDRKLAAFAQPLAVDAKLDSLSRTQPRDTASAAADQPT